MAVEAEGVAPATSRLPSDPALFAAAGEQFAAYRDAVAARWAIAPRARMTFVLWFSRYEQVLRYHAVKGNLFAREPRALPDLEADLYRAYLVESTIPGSADGAPKSAGRLLATEGVVSALFYRLATSAPLQRQYRPEDFYAAFGTARAAIDPIDNVYLKLFAAVKAGGYDTVAVIDAYRRLFPEDVAAVDEIVRSTLLGQDLPRGPAIWLLSDRLQTGTSLFDQYRGMPRSHTFDLNAASTLDLLSVRGMTGEIAAAILAGAPYESVDDLRRVPAARPVAAEIANMQAAYGAHVNAPNDGRRLSIKAVLSPYLRRAR
jgi:DNA uptake protein ComE-like DNA-binding protein